MLHIVLLILKIIGIVLLCMIGFMILALTCVLFVPVRYRIEVTRKEGEDQPPVVVRVKVTWLLHLLNILIRYPAEVMVRVRLMIFTILKMPDQKTSGEQEQGKKKKVKKKRVKEDKAKVKEEREVKKEKELKEEKEIKGIDSAKEIKDVKKSDNSKEKIPTVTIKAAKPEEAEDEAEKAPSFMEKLRALPVILKKIAEKIKHLFENIQYTIQRFCDRIKSISDNIQYYRKIVESEIFQNTFELCKGELTAILKSLRPQKFEAKLIVGMENPAVTGKILAICGMLYPVLGGHVDVVGDFERKRIEGHVLIKGRIRFFTFLRAAVRIYFNKDIKRLLKLLKKEAA